MHTICLKAMSRDDLESILPKPDLSWDDRDFSEELFLLEIQPSWFGGASFLMFTTLSTILLPITTGLTSSLQVESNLLMATTRIPLTYAIPFETRPLEDDRALGATGLILEAETGLSGNDVFKFVAPDFVTLFFNMGVVDLDVGFEAASAAGTEGLAVGVDERARGLVGVEDLTTGLMEGCVARKVGVEALGFAIVVGNVAREVGVEALEGFVLAGNVDRPIGVADLEAADFIPPVEDDRFFAAMEALEPEDKPG